LLVTFLLHRRYSLRKDYIKLTKFPIISVMHREMVVLIGTGGLGRETLWALRETGDEGPEVLGFLTNRDTEHGTDVCGTPVLGPESWIVGRPDVKAICCIGDPRARRNVVLSLERQAVQFATVIHPSALRSAHVNLGAGCVVGARAVLTTQVTLGDHVVVGVGAIVSHDSQLEDFATLGPGVVLAGWVTVQYGAELGAGASVVPRRTVGRGARVGAQAVVVHEVPPNTTVAGVPAKQLSSFPRDQWL